MAQSSLYLCPKLILFRLILFDKTTVSEDSILNERRDQQCNAGKHYDPTRASGGRASRESNQTHLLQHVKYAATCTTLLDMVHKMLNMVEKIQVFSEVFHSDCRPRGAGAHSTRVVCRVVCPPNSKVGEAFALSPNVEFTMEYQGFSWAVQRVLHKFCC